MYGEITLKLEESPYCFPDHENCGNKGQVETPGILSAKIVNTKQYSWRNAKINVTTKDLKDVRVVISINLHLTCQDGWCKSLFDIEHES